MTKLASELAAAPASLPSLSPLTASQELEDLRKAGNLPEALNLANTYALGFPDSSLVLCTAGRIFLESGQPARAKELFEAASKVNHRDPEPHNCLGTYFRREGNVPCAETAFKRALTCDSNSLKAREVLNVGLTRKGADINLRVAAAYCAMGLRDCSRGAEILGLQPKDPILTLAESALLSSNGQHTEALQTTAVLASEAQNTLRARVQIAMIHIMHGEIDFAVTSLVACCVVFPKAYEAIVLKIYCDLLKPDADERFAHNANELTMLERGRTHPSFTSLRCLQVIAAYGINAQPFNNTLDMLASPNLNYLTSQQADSFRPENFKRTGDHLKDLKDVIMPRLLFVNIFME